MHLANETTKATTRHKTARYEETYGRATWQVVETILTRSPMQLTSVVWKFKRPRLTAMSYHIKAKEDADADEQAKELRPSRACSMRMAVRHFRSLCKPLELEPHSRLGERLER